MIIETALVGIGVASSLTIAIGMALSRITTFQFWPPGKRDWRWWTYIGLSGLATGALVGVGYLDWNTYIFPRPSTLVGGAAVLAVGIAGFVAAIFDLGVEESGGMEGELRTGGYYQYSRNPQIVFLFLIIAGVVVTVNSLAVLLIATAMTVWFSSMPFAEEPWLRQQYGYEYRAYCREVPRFVGRQTVRKLLGSTV